MNGKAYDLLKEKVFKCTDCEEKLPYKELKTHKFKKEEVKEEVKEILLKEIAKKEEKFKAKINSFEELEKFFDEYWQGFR